MLKTSLLALTLALGAPAFAQTAASTPAKKELVAKIQKLQQPAVEQLARQLVEQPAAQMLQRAGAYMQARIEPDKREALARDLQSDARQYVEETYPLVREKALKLAPGTVGAMMEERLTEAELREVLRVFESAAWKKYQTLAGDMQKALGEKLVAEVKDQVEPKVRNLDQTMSRRLGITAPGAAASGASAGAGK